MVIEAWNVKKKNFFLGKKRYDKPRQYVKKQRHYLVNKSSSSKNYGFSSSLVWI